VLVDPQEIYPSKPRVLVSACLAGNKVRYDGGDKLQPWLLSDLQAWLEFETHCPEMAAEMGVPREPVQLVDDNGISVREVSRPQSDVSEQLRSSARDFLSRPHTWSAAILKARSPSCGSGTTPVYAGDGKQLRLGDGIFAGEFKDRFPGISVVDESLLQGAEARERFVYYCYLSMAEAQGRGIEVALRELLGWQTGLSFQQYLIVTG